MNKNLFATLGLSEALQGACTKAGYSTPTPIQTQAIPQVLAGKDVLGLAQTGTGKTAAFALPLLQRLEKPSPSGAPRVLVLAPTRELASQIRESFVELGRPLHLRSAVVFGGVSAVRQVEALKRGLDVLVACPGRLLDLLSQQVVSLSAVEAVVLDEADQMFDMGFIPDIRRILRQLPAQRQTLLFSATMPAEIEKLSREFLRAPVTVQVARSSAATTVTHAIYEVPGHLKTPLLLALLADSGEGSVLVFTRTKHRAKRLGEQLAKAGHAATSLQGNLSQNRREEAMGGFRDGTYRIMVATDIAARGIDVAQISHVFNYDVPVTPEAYVHRIGRTGRAARTGDAFTLVEADDAPQVRAIEKLLGKPLERRRLEGFDYSAAAPPRAAPDPFARGPRPPRRPSGPAKSARPAAKPAENKAAAKPSAPQAPVKPSGPAGEAPRRPRRRRRGGSGPRPGSPR